MTDHRDPAWYVQHVTVDGAPLEPVADEAEAHRVAREAQHQAQLHASDVFICAHVVQSYRYAPMRTVATYRMLHG